MINYGIEISEGTRISNLTVDDGSVFPIEPSVGELFFKTPDNLLYVYTGTSWNAVGGDLSNVYLPLTGGTLTGNLTVNGTMTTINSTTVDVEDPIISIGDSTLTVNDGMDRGIEFKYHDATSSKIGFFGYNNSSEKFTFILNATNAGETFTGIKGYVDAFIEFNNITDLPTTLSGYGITDAAPLSHVGSGGTAHTNATTSVAGFMSASDKAKLDGISAGANNYILPTASAGTLGGIKKGSGLSIQGDGTLSADVTSVNNMTGDVTISYVPYANALQTARTIQATGDASWLVTFDGSTAVSAPLTLTNSGVVPGTYTSLTVDAKGRATFGENPTTLSGYGITDAQPLDADLTAIAELSETSGFLKKTGVNTWAIDNSVYLTANQVITLVGDVTGNGTTSITTTLSNTGVTPGTYNSVTVDSKGRVVYATNPTTLFGYGITDAAPLSHVGAGGTAHTNATTSVAGFMSASDKAKLDGISAGANTYTLPVATSSVLGGIKDGVGVTIDVDGTLSADVTSVNGQTGAVSITTITGNAGTASTLQTPRTISSTGDASWSVTFDGSSNVSSTSQLSNTGVTPGTYRSVTVDAKGRISSGSNPTTLSGYGITDAAPLSHVGAGGTAHANATTAVAGFMSASDKTKLDGISAGAAVLSVAGKTGDVTLTPSDVSLSNVENKSSATIRSEITNTNVTTALGFTPENSSNKNTVNGYAGLDSLGKIPTSLIPAVAITDVFVVNSQAAMLALTAETGDVAVRTDVNKSFILKGSTASVLSDWQELLSSTSTVTSVNGMTGDVLITSVTGNAGTASTLQTPRTISSTGDASWSVSFDGSTDVSSALTLTSTGVTPGTYKSLSVDAKGRVTGGSNPTTLSGYGITDAAPLSHVGAGGTAHTNATTSVAGFMSASDKTKLDGISAGANNYSLPIATVSTLGGVKDGAGVTIAGDGTISADVTSVNGQTGAVSINTITGNAGTASTLQTPRTISSTGDASWSVSFDGSANVSSALTLTNSGVVAGTYNNVTVDVKGRVTNGTLLSSSNITTALGYTPSKTSLSNETNSVIFADTRVIDDTPTSRSAGIFFDFKQNSTNGLSDGGTYNTQLTLRGYGTGTDLTGANFYQIAFTAGGNMWLRTHTSATTWGTWYKFWHQNNDGAGSGLDSDLLDGQQGTYYLDWSNFTNKPTTLSGYGITDAQPLDADLTAIAGLSGTTGLLRKTAVNTWTLDTTAYLTSNQTITLTGDATASGTTNLSVVLSSSGVVAGTYGSATVIPQITFDSKGRAIAASNIAVTPAWSSITGKPTTLSGYGITDAQPLDADLTAIAGLSGTTGLLRKTAANTWTLDTTAYLTSNQTITFSGDVTGTGSTSVTLTLANSGVTSGTYNNSPTSVTPLTVDSKGRITSTGSAVVITPAWSSITSKPTTISGYGITDGVTLSGTEYLSNKYLVDNSTYIFDGSDTSKILRFELSNISTNNTRVLSVPDVSGTIVTTGDTGSVTNVMLAGNIANAKLQNSSVTVNGITVSLGGSATVTANTPNAITFTNSGLGATSGSTFNGNATLTVSHNTIGALSLSGGTMTGDLYLDTMSTERDFGWNFTGRNVYLYGRDSDDRVGLYDSVLAANRWYTDTSGNFVASGDVTAFSDSKLKKDLTRIDNALEKIQQLTGYTFTRVDTNQRQMGLIAQDVMSVAPEVVHDNGDVMSVAYGNLMGMVVEAIKELKKEIDELKTKL